MTYGWPKNANRILFLQVFVKMVPFFQLLKIVIKKISMSRFIQGETNLKAFAVVISKVSPLFGWFGKFRHCYFQENKSKLFTYKIGWRWLEYSS